MRRVLRKAEPAPASLTVVNRVGPKELAKARIAYGETPPGKITFTAYKSDDVRQALERLFHGKCAYCESRYDITGPVDIEHYRPKKGVEGEPDHPGYWWLAGEWENLLPSCLDCNRRRYQATVTDFVSVSAVLDAALRTGFSPLKTGKETSFPITGSRLRTEPSPGDRERVLKAEQALLLDPCVDNPAEHLRHYINRETPLGLIVPTGGADPLPALAFGAAEDAVALEKAARLAGLSARGSVSIQVYGLNRLGLVQERTRLLRRLEVLGDLVLDLFALADEIALLDVPPSQRSRVTELSDRARAMGHRGLAEIRSAAAPEAPFSSLAAAWTTEYKKDLTALLDEDG